MAWVEYLKLNPENEMVCAEISKDIDKLNVITQRFSQVGKTPKKIELNILDVIRNTVDYIKNRTSKKVNYEIILPEENCLNIELNQHLFEWALENLIKNAIDAMNGAGAISVTVSQNDSKAIVEIADTGKGIAKSKHKRVFEPGYTTKKRGWGLGLSLAKRIMEQYHKGRIFVKQSAPGKGTVFRLELKK